MDEKRINYLINKVKERDPEIVFAVLFDGRIVVGEAVDPDNRLLYIIRDPKDDSYTVEKAFNQKVVSRNPTGLPLTE